MATCYNRYTRQYYYCQSRWGSWGRWVALGVILVGAFLIFFLCACLSQRRRRKAGRKPYYGTGWVPAGNVGNQNSQYQAPPPQYGQQHDGAPQGGYYGQGQNQHGGANQSYFGGQRNDVEMQPPQTVYGGQTAGGYAPPSGPPPAKY